MHDRPGAAELLLYYGDKPEDRMPDRFRQADELFEVARRSPAGSRASSCAMTRPAAVHGGTEKFQTDPTGATTSFSMSTSTATTARGWAPATRPAGQEWLPR